MRILTLLIAFAILFSFTSFAQKAKCDYKVEIVANGTEFEKEEFTWRMKAVKMDGAATNITGTAEIQSNGEIVKKYKPWTSDSISRQKTSSEYSPNLKSGEYKIIVQIGVECDDTNKTNNIDVKTIRITEQKIEQLEETKNEEAKSYNAATNKAEDTEAKNNIVNEEIKNKTEDVVEYLNSTPKEIKNITAQLQKGEEADNVIRLTKGNKAKNEFKATADAVKVSQTVYVSSSEKSKNLILVFLLVLSILLNIILVWKR